MATEFKALRRAHLKLGFTNRVDNTGVDVKVDPTYFEVTEAEGIKLNAEALQKLNRPQTSADIYVSGGQLDTDGTTLKLTRENGAELSLDLGKLAESKVANSDTVTLEGTGKTGTPLKASVKITTGSDVKDAVYLQASDAGLSAVVNNAKLMEALVKESGGLKNVDGQLAVDKAVLFDVHVVDHFTGESIGYMSSTNA